MSSYLYYGCDSPVLSDGDYEEMVQLAAAGWADLHEDRKWALKSRKAMLASGFQTRFTPQAVAAARAWHRDILHVDPPKDGGMRWRTDKRTGRTYAKL